MSTWEERMSQRAKARAAVAEAEQIAREAARQHELADAFPAVPGEFDDVIDGGPHHGHRQHLCGSAVMCSRGDLVGVVGAVVVSDGPAVPCPVCAARGLPGD